MKRKLADIAIAFCMACALLSGAASAYAADEPGSGDAPSSAASAQASDSAAENSVPAPNDQGQEAAESQVSGFQQIYNEIYNVVTPIAGLDKNLLFKRQYDWVAVENLNFDSANEDGSLSEWQTDWFISHDWSDYGHVIAGLEPGDAVTVNGVTTLILGREEWPSGVINWDVYDAIGWDKTVFQTCLGDTAIWIAYGLHVYPTPAFLADHPPTA